jgi:hypothetical protein
MSRTRTLYLLAMLTGATALWTGSILGAQETKKAHVMVTPATTKWAAGPASLPPGAQASALEGDPAKPGPFMPSGTRHFAWTKGETVVQLHGTGPWGINYVNAADDPRKKPGVQ